MFHIFQHNLSKGEFPKLLGLLLFSPHPTLGFWPNLAIPNNQCSKKIIGGKEKGSLVFKVLPKKRIGLNGTKIGPHSHKVVTKRYNVSIGSLFTNCA